MEPLTPRQLLALTHGRERSCEPAVCDLWLLSASVGTPDRANLETLLSPAEREQAGRFHFEADRVRSIVARGGLRQILSAYCGTPALALEFRNGPHGKPALAKPSTALECNVSHSGDCVLIAVTSGVACGVDIELEKRIPEENDLAERYFCPREVDWLARTQDGFHRLWTTKEAILKATGIGLSIPLSHVDVTDGLDGKAPYLTMQTPGSEPTTFWLSELFLLPGYAAAVATMNHPRTLRLICNRW